MAGSQCFDPQRATLCPWYINNYISEKTCTQKILFDIRQFAPKSKFSFYFPFFRNVIFIKM